MTIHSRETKSRTKYSYSVPESNNIKDNDPKIRALQFLAHAFGIHFEPRRARSTRRRIQCIPLFFLLVSFLILILILHLNLHSRPPPHLPLLSEEKEIGAGAGEG